MSLHTVARPYAHARRKQLKISASWTSLPLWEKSLERVKGIEPSYSAWEAAALPLSYTRRLKNFRQNDAAVKPPRKAFHSRPAGSGRSLGAEMLGEFQALSLIVGAEARAVETFGFGQHMFIDKAADDLAVLQDEGYLVASDF